VGQPIDVVAVRAGCRNAGAWDVIRTGVGSEHDIGVEHREQRIEVTLSRGSEERRDDLALVPSRSARATVAGLRTRRRARLASCLVAVGDRRTIGGCR